MFGARIYVLSFLFLKTLSTERVYTYRKKHRQIVECTMFRAFSPTSCLSLMDLCIGRQRRRALLDLVKMKRTDIAFTISQTMGEKAAERSTMVFYTLPTTFCLRRFHRTPREIRGIDSFIHSGIDVKINFHCQVNMSEDACRSTYCRSACYLR